MKAQILIASRTICNSDVADTGEMIWFDNVYVYTNIINTFDEIKSTFKYTSSTKLPYGVGTHYILGGNIDAEGQTHNSCSWVSATYSEIGFMGIFDGRGYTINDIVLLQGGLFGYLGNDAVVKNFALTNVTFGETSSNGTNSAIAFYIAGTARIENIFVDVNKITDESKAKNSFLFAALVRGNRDDPTITPVIENAVMKMSFEGIQPEGEKIASYADQFSSGNFANNNNVHIISDYYLLSNGTDEGTWADINITRYGANTTYATFADRYAPLETNLETDIGLSSDYWVFNDTMDCPMFISSLQYYS